MNEKTLPTQSLTISDFDSHIDRDQESRCLGNFNQDSISSHHVELDQYQTINKFASFHFNEIELEHECEPDLQIYDSVSISEFMLILTRFGLNFHSNTDSCTYKSET